MIKHSTVTMATTKLSAYLDAIKEAEKEYKDYACEVMENILAELGLDGDVYANVRGMSEPVKGRIKVEEIEYDKSGYPRYPMLGFHKYREDGKLEYDRSALEEHIGEIHFSFSEFKWRERIKKPHDRDTYFLCPDAKKLLHWFTCDNEKYLEAKAYVDKENEKKAKKSRAEEYDR